MAEPIKFMLVEGAAPAPDSRKLCVRLFQDRTALMLSWMSPADFTAWVRLAIHYVRVRGELAADDRLLAHFSGLPLKQWQKLRAELIANDLAEVRDGRWIDADQDCSIEAQIKSSDRQRRAARARWDKHRAR